MAKHSSKADYWGAKYKGQLERCLDQKATIEELEKVVLGHKVTLQAMSSRLGNYVHAQKQMKSNIKNWRIKLMSITPEEALSPAQLALHTAIEDQIRAEYQADTSYHRSLAKPLTLKVLSKKQRKQVTGPNATTMKSINHKTSEQFKFSDGTVYMGLPARYMDIGKGLGMQKMANGIPFVKVAIAG